MATATATGTVWVLTIEHRHGEDRWVCLTEDRARRELRDWVTTYWDQDGPDTDMPEDPDAAVTAYFDHQEVERDRYGEGETYGISAEPLLP